MKIDWFKKKVIKDIVLVRVCIGCVLPHNAKLIGTGNYILLNNKGKVNEQYYDYEIFEEDLQDFLEINSPILIKNQLLDEQIEETIEDKNPVKPTTIRGWSKKS